MSMRDRVLINIGVMLGQYAVQNGDIGILDDEGELYADERPSTLDVFNLLQEARGRLQEHIVQAVDAGLVHLEQDTPGAVVESMAKRAVKKALMSSGVEFYGTGG